MRSLEEKRLFRFDLRQSSALALAVAFIGGSALAQATAARADAPGGVQATEPSIIEEVVVTAQFRSQRLQDTPIAITAVSSQLLEARGQTNITDVASFAPNVNLAPAYSSFGSSINAFIRGVGQSDSNFALEPGVGVYIDDIYYGATFGAVFDLTDLDRVEVLRGPQGTLAGKNSIGGSLKLFSKKPDGDGGGYVEGAYGSFGRTDLRASADFTVADGLYARLSGIVKHRRGFLDRLDFGCANPGQGIPASPSASSDCKIGTEGGQDMTALRLAVRYAPSASPLEINVIGDVSDDKSEPTASKLLYAGNPGVRSYDAASATGGVPFDSRFLTSAKSYTSYASYRNGGNYTTVFGTPYQVTPGTFTAPADNTVKSWGVSAAIDYRFSDALSLKSITGYRKADGESGVDLDASPLDLGTQVGRFSHAQFTQELRLSGKIGSLVDYTVGGYFYDAKDRIQQRVEFPTVMLDFLANDPVKTRSKSAFTHVEIHPTQRLNVIMGLRYTRDRKIYTFSRRNLDGSVPNGAFLTPNFTLFGLDGLSDTFEGDRWDYRLGVNYRWSEALMTYAQVSTGFKGGGVNPRPYTAAQLATFGPETLTSYETGFKSDLMDRKIRINGAVFFNKYKDIQLSLQACPGVPCAMPANAGDADVKGAELEVALRPMRGLSIDASLGYLDFEYTRVDPATGIGLDFIAPFTSKWQSSLGIEYAADLGDAGMLTPRIDLAYQSSFFFNANNAPGSIVDGRRILNARLGYEPKDGDWSAAFGVTNLTDKFYYVAKNDNVAGFGVNQGVLGRPREWSLTLKRRF